MGFNRIYQSGMIVIYDLHPWSVRDLQSTGYVRGASSVTDKSTMPYEYIHIQIRAVFYQLFFSQTNIHYSAHP